MRAIAGYNRLAAEIAATHATLPTTTWDAPAEMLDAACGLFTAERGGREDGADAVLAGIARILAHGPYPAVRLHATGCELLPPDIRPERPLGPPEEDVLLHAIALATSPGTEPWPHGPVDRESLSEAIPALAGAVPCRTTALRAVAVRYLLRRLPSADDRHRRWLLRRIAWLLDPRTDDAGTLLCRLTGPDDPLVARLGSQDREASPPDSSEPFPPAGWPCWQTEDGMLRLGGRILALREHRRLTFADLGWDGHTAQLAISRDLAAGLRAGDLVAVRGTRGISRTGQPTVFVTRLERREPGAVRAAPDALAATAVLRAVREHLAAAGFAEVITPVLTDGYFGGAARPFATWAAAAGRHQYLRVTTELALLDVIASGTSRCYEIGPSFRNEGLRGQPAKEFLMLEAYAVDFDLGGMTEYAVSLARKVTVHQGSLRRMSFDEAFREVSGVDLSDVPAIRALSDEHIPVTAARTDDPDILARRLWRSSLRHRLQGLAAIDGIPGPASPLIAGTGRAAQRVWLYVDGLEVAEVSRNERNTGLLAEAFQSQFADDPHPVHRDYRKAVDMFAGGVPPCVGIGLSVTRLAQLARRHATRLTVPSPRQESR
ncbi:amino acid--tRNA ligase-related protein [Kitasatospora sp. NPDC092286]|uniref:amino acid--tRNA ligase-related protein n=1 Tax=Kitasatospora sp. NPDC092286 TaxID=3364087 RepID=UPI00382758DF